MPDWFISTVSTYPAIIWIVIGCGLPAALIVLPRPDWRDRVMVTCLSLAFGPALLTAWMFILGTLGQDTTPGAGDPLNPMQTLVSAHVGGQSLLRADLILLGTIIIAMAAWGIAWHKLRTTSPADKPTQTSLAPDETVLIALIVFATIGRWFIGSWLSFGAWDAQWVYGYQSRIYTLLGYIPSDIGYYPQFMPLQFAFGQIVSAGEINDHAARAMMPLTQIGSILAAYLLGSRLFTRRTGILAAAIWALYPHFGYWTRIADLEIPLTFGFTGAALFFLMAWMPTHAVFRRRYAIIAGLFLGIAMWTKPTAGALIWGVVLIVIVELIRQRFDVQKWLPRFSVAFWMGIATIPLGSAWYLRNIIVGHDAVTFPPSVWLGRAMRSGQEFGWPLAALSVLLLYLYLRPARYRPDLRLIVPGFALVLVGLMPTILEPARLIWWEWLAFGTGAVVLTLGLGDYALAHRDTPGARNLAVIGWAGVLILPYFVTWFYSYSYAYRLSFAIVPVMILPTALILAHWLTPEKIAAWRFPLRFAYAGAIITLALPGAVNFVSDADLGWDWLWTIPKEDDYSKAALLGVVDTLGAAIAENDAPPVIVAPGMQTLPFFFPTLDIDVSSRPSEIADLDDVTHFIFTGPVAEEWYLGDGFSVNYPGGRLPFQSQLFNGLFRENVAGQPIIFEDSAFSFAIYTVDSTRRFEEPDPPPLIELPEIVQFGDFARFIGYSYADETLAYTPGFTGFHMVFEVTAEVDEDYFIYMHLIDPDDPDTPLAFGDGPVREAYQAMQYYATYFWEPGEYVIDRRNFWYGPIGVTGDDFRLRIGFYSQRDGHRAPVTINGEPAGDGFILPTEFTVPPP